MEAQISNRSRTVTSIILYLFVLITMYSGNVFSSADYYPFRSGINGINVLSRLENNENRQMIPSAEGYTLTLKERGNREEQIRGYEIGLKYTQDWGFGDPAARQCPNVLGKVFINNEDPRMGASYDKELLHEKLDNLSCFDKDTIIEPVNPALKFTGNGYVIMDEVDGNKVDKDILYKQVAEAMLSQKSVLDLDATGCYVKPHYNPDSKEVMEAKDTLNKCVSSNITYTFGKYKEVIDGSVINRWLTVDENYNVTINDESIKGYLKALSGIYGSSFKAGTFITSSGKKMDLSGKGINLAINIDKEAKELADDISMGKTAVKDPLYVPAIYVEIDLTKQHLWLYKNGSLITDGDIVSGNLSWGMPTPEGVYSVYSMKRDAVLRGPGYAAPVDYWMPFVDGIGIHDAVWRHAFGGDIYKTDGSHGCINCPYELAETIFNNIDVGTPVICYY